MFIRDHEPLRRTQESKTRQAPRASRAADFSTHKCNASDEEFMILSRFELEFPLPPPSKLLLLLPPPPHLSSANPEFGK